MRTLTPEPLTATAFAPFGRVIEASDAAVKLDINQGHAVRYDNQDECLQACAPVLKGDAPPSGRR